MRLQVDGAVKVGQRIVIAPQTLIDLASVGDDVGVTRRHFDSVAEVDQCLIVTLHVHKTPGSIGNARSVLRF